MAKDTVVRYHDFSCGHRVVGHEGACALLHGHNYRVSFFCEADKLDKVGRVVDFSVVKARLCLWLENNWDHRFLAWKQDPLLATINSVITRPGDQARIDSASMLTKSIVWLTFNPTAENLANHLLGVVGPLQLRNTNVILTKVIVEETRKCSAVAEL